MTAMAQPVLPLPPILLPSADSTSCPRGDLPKIHAWSCQPPAENFLLFTIQENECLSFLSPGKSLPFKAQLKAHLSCAALPPSPAHGALPAWGLGPGDLITALAAAALVICPGSALLTTRVSFSSWGLSPMFVHRYPAACLAYTGCSISSD